MAEFALIDRFFRDVGPKRDDVTLAIGDDAALIRTQPHVDLVSTTSTLAAGSAYAWTDKPDTMGHRLLSTALNQLSATGAEPAWATLTITLPKADETWLEAFCQGLTSIASSEQVQLIGGDTTSGPLSATIVVTGTVASGKCVQSVGAKVGEQLMVIGEMGLSATAMLATAYPTRFDRLEREQAAMRFQFPRPVRTAATPFGSTVSAAVDLTEGIQPALQRLLENSTVGARVDLGKTSLSVTVRQLLTEMHMWPRLMRLRGDHAICVSLPSNRSIRLQRACSEVGLPCTTIGIVTAGQALEIASAPG